MQLNIMLDDHLLKDAQQASGLPSAQATIEAALRALISQRDQETSGLLKKFKPASVDDNAAYLHKMQDMHTASLEAAAFWQPQALSYYLENQHAVSDVAELDTDFWPEDESVDDFVAFIRQQHREKDTRAAHYAEILARRQRLITDIQHRNVTDEKSAPSKNPQ